MSGSHRFTLHMAGISGDSMPRSVGQGSAGSKGAALHGGSINGNECAWDGGPDPVGVTLAYFR